MDYGQNTKPGDNNQAFFTAGVGNDSPEQNISSTDTNINLNNQTISWDQSQNNSENQRATGNKALEALDQTLEHDLTDVIDNQKNGQIIDFNPSTDASNEKTAPEVQASSIFSFNPDSIRAEQDHISSETLRQIANIESELAQTQNAADFYAAIRGDDSHQGMSKDYIENSFHKNKEVG